MIWMEERAHHRESPASLWPEVRSVIALGMSYAPAADPLALAGEGEVGRISVYAQGGDYHDLIKRKLKELARWLVGAAPGADVKVFVDTAPVMEKPLSEAAGLGWQGKHTNLVSRSHGSWLFLGAIYTTLDLAPDRGRPLDLRKLRRVPDRVPDRRVSGAVPARCAALHLLPHDRAQRPDPARIPREDRATASMAATIASRSARGTSSPPPPRPISPSLRAPN